MAPAIFSYGVQSGSRSAQAQNLHRQAGLKRRWSARASISNGDRMIGCTRHCGQTGRLVSRPAAAAVAGRAADGGEHVASSGAVVLVSGIASGAVVVTMECGTAEVRCSCSTSSASESWFTARRLRAASACLAFSALARLAATFRALLLRPPTRPSALMSSLLFM